MAGDDAGDGLDRQRIWEAFREVVNMAPAELATWLETEESRTVGLTRDGDDESVGHRSGRRIVEIRRKARAELDTEDYRHMRKVVGYVRRHLAQGGPAEDPAHSRWRYSLMNWGHDPMKD